VRFPGATLLILEYPLAMGRIDRLFNRADLFQPFFQFLLDQITRILSQVFCPLLGIFRKSGNLIIRRDFTQFMCDPSEALQKPAHLLLLLAEKLISYHERDVELDLTAFAEPCERAERTRVASAIAAEDVRVKDDVDHGQIEILPREDQRGSLQAPPSVVWRLSSDFPLMIPKC